MAARNRTDNELFGLVERVEQIRTRLMLFTVLRNTAVGCLFVLAYVLVYAFLDHHLHFSTLARVAALILFLLPLGYGFFRMFRQLKQETSISHAARYIENHHSYHQELVATVEYYQNQQEYPYSQELAHYMVQHVGKVTQNADFKETLPRKRTRLFLGVVTLAVAATAWMLVSNGVYFQRYATRLLTPMASVAPLPATTLTLLTGDIVCAPEKNVRVAAEISGKIPERGELLIRQDAESEEIVRRITLRPQENAAAADTLESFVQLPQGKYTYQFRAEEGSSPRGKILVEELPEIAQLIAHVSPPKGLDSEAYTVPVEKHALRVIKGSQVELRITPTLPLQSISVHAFEKEVTGPAIQEEGDWLYAFDALQPGKLHLSLTSASGLTSEKQNALTLMLDTDAPPAFDYESPGTDYLATNVASIPVRMKISDDFGLERAALVLEIDGEAPLRLPATLPDGAKEVVLDHVLELEEYDLEVGDTVLVYAEAMEKTSIFNAEATLAQSDLYLIEIKAYQQLWHQISAALPSDFTPQGLDLEDAPDSLLALLEFTRAIMKKTWNFSADDTIPEAEKPLVDATAKDAMTLVQKLRKSREFYRKGMTEAQVNSMIDAGSAMLAVRESLEGYDAKRALPHAKEAYRILRVLAVELEKALFPPGGGGGMKQDLESIELKEQVHLSRYDDEQIQWELKQLTQKVAALKEKQKELGERFLHFLRKQAAMESQRQQSTDESSWNQEGQVSSDKTKQPGGASGAMENKTVSVEGALLESTSGSGSSSVTSPNEATPQEQLEMMQAAEKALQDEAEAMAAMLAELAKAQQDATGAEDSSGNGTGSGSAQAAAQKAQEHLETAAAHMESIDKALSDAYYQSKGYQDALDDIEAAMENALSELENAEENLDSLVEKTAMEQTAKLLEDQAREIAELAKELELTEDFRRQKELQQELKTLTATGMSEEKTVVGSLGGQLGAPPSYITLVNSIVPPNDVGSIPGFIDTSPRRAAYWLAEQYWSLAIQARKEAGTLREVSASDARFRNYEVEFFEQAAQYNARGER